MTDDRALLEAAARAAGMEIHHWSTILPGPMMVDPVTADCGGYWNPLEEDGDALRLAVRLGLLVDTSDGVHVQYIKDGIAHPIVDYDTAYPFNGTLDEACAVTRRLIVRAAASLSRGERMEG